ncbi:MAG: hypothetical protein CVU11_15550 [Bacteroidetes bacterium HGW-Bacteroidetes-6]|nr:MAG: hypothetical protein CVU11_15550 [Bacteroidetes bacterium HGW-Bacteroidetes-6]
MSLAGTAQKPETIVSFVIEEHECDWYKTQADLWKKETEKNNKNADAWMNYYKATRYSDMMCAENQYKLSEESYKKLNDILVEMEKAVPESYEYNYLMFYNGGNDPAKNKYLLKAYEIDQERSEIYSSLIVYDEINGKYADKKKILEKQQQKQPYSTGLMAWNYNALFPLEKNAIVLTGGDNDTYMKWALQDVNGIRQDVQVINMSLILVEDYRKRLFEEAGIAPFKTKVDSTNYMNYTGLIIEHICKNSGNRPVYISNTMSESNYSSLKDSLYLEGLVYKYSGGRYDNVAVIRKNYEQVFLLDYIKAPLLSDVSQSIVNRSNLNYIPAFLQLYDHYKLSGDNDKANKLGVMLRLIASKSGNEGYTQYIEEYLKDE